jgi:hypothetical protein
LASLQHAKKLFFLGKESLALEDELPVLRARVAA